MMTETHAQFSLYPRLITDVAYLSGIVLKEKDLFCKVTTLIEMSR